MSETLSENGLDFVLKIGSCGESIESYLGRGGALNLGYHGLCLLKGGFY